MAFVSMKNLLDPLTNKGHLITIIMVIVLYAVLRLSNGGMSTHSNEEVVSQKNPITEEIDVAEPSAFDIFKKQTGKNNTKQQTFGRKTARSPKAPQPKKSESTIEEIFNSLN